MSQDGIIHDEENWIQTIATRLIDRYLFPDGELDCTSNIRHGTERGGLERFGLYPHYAMTLRHFVRRPGAIREQALREVEEPIYRVARLREVS